MTFSYHICHPDKEEIEYFNEVISKEQVLEMAKNYPWILKLDFIENYKGEIYYSPSIGFKCIENGKSLELTADTDLNSKLEFSLWYNRPKYEKENREFGENEDMVVDEKWSISYYDTMQYLEHFVNGDYSIIENLYKNKL